MNACISVTAYLYIKASIQREAFIEVWDSHHVKGLLLPFHLMSVV